ncbi:hypothetical protein ACWEPH_10735 [Nocardia beijingensis]|uniref:hypothetical protein n=1 Tax=Nocardia beijingensis TaxID=95162 RepID=UPI0018932EB4|nr:hypothetical protein [Nocardia beijingensis]MBF6073478.1 hypothetical protein [Nocardia beijingensis]
MSEPHPVLGTWEVHADSAPFGYHVMQFHPGGTMLQSNPDHGNRTTSDSNGMGTWRCAGDRVIGAFLEFTVDRADPDVVRKGIVAFDLDVTGDEFTGLATATFYELSGEPVGAPATARLTGRRFDGVAAHRNALDLWRTV